MILIVTRSITDETVGCISVAPCLGVDSTLPLPYTHSLEQETDTRDHHKGVLLDRIGLSNQYLEGPTSNKI